MTYCGGCGARFDDENGTPRLIPRQASRTVAFEFPQERSLPGASFTKCFRYPQRSGAAKGGDAPYHLDLAHVDVLADLPTKALVLEIGCGGGQMRKYLQKRGHFYVGTDLSSSRVSEDLRKHGGPDLLCDSHFLPFLPAKFDAVYSAAVTEHLASPYLACQEVARVLKPGGIYMGNVSFLEPWHDNSYFHMSPLGVFEILTQARLDVESIWPGRGYSAFRAVMRMGNKATRSLTFLGDLMYIFYRFANEVRNVVRGRNFGGIEDAARVAGAIDWIARKPP